MSYWPLAKRRRRLTARFRPIVDGLIDKARDTRPELREPLDGQWTTSHAHSHDVEVIERTSGNPLRTLGRALDCVHRGEIRAVALIGIGDDGVIHTAWSDGDIEVMGRAASFLADDLRKASER